MGRNELEIYKQLRHKEFSQGCESQAFHMLLAIEKYLLSDFSYKHSLLRLFIRPLFYMGYENPETVLDFVYYCKEHHVRNENDKFKHPNELCKFMKENSMLILKVVDELQLCCAYYDVEYSAEKNAVIFRNQVFHNIEELWQCFLADFQKLDIPDDEISRIFEEESKEYEKAFQKIKV